MTMFDQLQDPDPPEATSRHLAVVAERAAGMRRRRTALVSGAAVLGLVASGTIAVAVTGRSGPDDTELAVAPLPEVTQPAPAPSSAPVTTVLDPESLPPAVPVNPDPEDLPPAVPVDRDPTDEPGVSTDAAPPDSSGDEVGANDGGDDVTDDSSDAPPASDAGIDVGQAAARRAADPVTAITTSGVAVWFPAVDEDPIPVTSIGNVSRLDFLADGTATVEFAGSSVLTPIGPDGAAGDALSLGTSHAVGPDGSTICALGGSTDVRCAGVGGDVRVVDLDRADVVGVDLTWAGSNTVLVLGRSDAWTMTRVDLTAGTATTQPFASLGSFATLRFAGRDAGGAVIVHDAGTDVALVGSLDRYGGWDPDGDDGGGTTLEVRRWDEPMRSIWLDGGAELLVDVAGGLTIDGDPVPGTYLAARV